MPSRLLHGGRVGQQWLKEIPTVSRAKWSTTLYVLVAAMKVCIRGKGYLFFGGGDAVHWLSSSVSMANY